MKKELNISYESAIERLEQIVDNLASGSVSLDESLKLYEEGTRLTAYCNEKIENAKSKIVEIEKE